MHEISLAFRVEYRHIKREIIKRKIKAAPDEKTKLKYYDEYLNEKIKAD